MARMGNRTNASLGVLRLGQNRRGTVTARKLSTGDTLLTQGQNKILLTEAQARKLERTQ